jgi:proteasome accessory factor C
MSAQDALTRIVQLVAELTRAERAGEGAATVDALAQRFQVPAGQIAADLRALTLLGEHADHEWLLSLSVWQQQDRVSITSGGPFRRPLVFTPAERLAIQVALALDPEGEALARRLAAAGRAESPAGSAALTDADPLLVCRAAIANHQRVALQYAGADDPEPRPWLVEPHQLVEYRHRHYAICWCPDTRDWRHFRLDRMLAARSLPDRFEPRPDFRVLTRVEDVFRPGGGAGERVRVRFAATVARWIKERYLDCEDAPDGSVVVTLDVASEAWLVRRVLEHGENAEVLGPARYRVAVGKAVA